MGARPRRRRTRALACARRLLASARHTTLPIAVVAARCGFTSPSHFTRRFRGAYATTLSEWRRLARNRETIEEVPDRILGAPPVRW
ncbi:AraC family transcriptional regulator [Streptomyces sp. NPDC051909]|uniref:AraC family transcriptional regulator n=1 Tax=Streptomyces sp. NPDC051909 TaxID=3154944 RepID=UPI00342EB765